MHLSDLINAAFELFAGGFCMLNIRRLYKDKQVRGVSIIAVSFFTSWGFWNLYYYPSLGQWLSFIGGLSIVSFNVIYVVMMFHYTRKPHWITGTFHGSLLK